MDRVVRDGPAEQRCPFCHAWLDGAEVEVADQRCSVVTLTVTCPRCAVRLSVVLTLDQPGGESAHPEFPLAQGPITADDLLDVHERLQGLSGSLTELLRG